MCPLIKAWRPLNINSTGTRPSAVDPKSHSTGDLCQEGPKTKTHKSLRGSKTGKCIRFWYRRWVMGKLHLHSVGRKSGSLIMQPAYGASFSRVETFRLATPNFHFHFHFPNFHFRRSLGDGSWNELRRSLHIMAHVLYGFCCSFSLLFFIFFSYQSLHNYRRRLQPELINNLHSVGRRRLLGSVLFINYFLIALAIAQLRAQFCFAFFALSPLRILNISLGIHIYFGCFF